jgi:hypothetical protein
MKTTKKRLKNEGITQEVGENKGTKNLASGISQDVA